MSNLVVQTNVLALNSHRNLKVVGAKQSVASARLSSGYRVNSAADDAAGLAISEKMRAQIRGLDMASKNTQDGISLVQTAEGGMQEIDNMIQRIRELAVQAANDTNDFDTFDRQKIQDEIDQLTDGIDAMAGQVEFNAKKLLDGSLAGSDTKNATLAQINKRILSATGNTDGTVAAVNSAMGGEFAKIIGGIGTGALGAVASADVTLGAEGTYAGYTVNVAAVASIGMAQSSNLSSWDEVDKYLTGLDTYVAKVQASYEMTGAADAENALTAAKQVRTAVMEAASLYQTVGADLKARSSADLLNGENLWFQTGANQAQGIEVGVGSIKTNILGIGDGAGTSTLKINQDSGMHISAFIKTVDNALQYVTAERAKLGAVQNRLDYTKSSLEISSENLSAAESRIRDADMAKEMMKLTAANVLQQAGVSMLAQANQAPQSVLSLLR